MRKKIALCLALAMSLSMTACKATPTNSPSVETSESTTEKTYTAKNLSDEEFYKLRVLAPDGNTPDNPGRYGEYGMLQFFSSVTPENYNEIKKVTGYPTTYKNHAVPTKDSWHLMQEYETGGGTYLAYDGSECPYTAFRLLTVEEFQNPENWDDYYHIKEDPYASKEKNAMNMALIGKGDYIDGYDAAEYVKKEWTDNYEAFLKFHDKYVQGQYIPLNGDEYYAIVDKTFKYKEYQWNFDTTKLTQEDYLSYSQYYEPEYIDEYRTNWDQTHKLVQQNEYPKVLDIVNRYLRAKYLGEDEVYTKDFTEDFLATANFNPEVIKEYYNKNGAIFTDVVNVQITHSNFDLPIVPVVVKYTLRTENYETTVRDYIYMTYTYNSETDDFEYQLAYTANEETLLESYIDMYDEEKDSRVELEKMFVR